MQKTYETATGKIDYQLTNDIMFRLVLERNQTVLNELIRSLLHLKQADLVEAKIQNPISLGEDVKDKTFVLDAKILLNQKDIVNIEMQVVNKGNWPDRSLSYLCRAFDKLMRGSDYSATSTVIHISILDFTLFPEQPEFYALYRLMNVKNHQIYNDKFRLNVLCLNQVGLAIDEDREAGLDQWAALFRAQTWEDIKMLAQKNLAFHETARELYKANADPATRAQAEAYEEYMRQERYNQRKMEEAQRKLAEAREENMRQERYSQRKMEEAQRKLAEAREENMRQERYNQRKMEEAQRKLAEAREENMRQERYSQRKLEEAEKALLDKDAALAEKAAELAKQAQEIAVLRAQLEQLKK